jgi:hypothetical protein
VAGLKKAVTTAQQLQAMATQAQGIPLAISEADEEHDPISIEEAASSPGKQIWQKAILSVPAVDPTGCTCTAPS